MPKKIYKPSLLNYIMNWDEWYHWKKRRFIAVILFIVAYIITIPIRDYESLIPFVDTTQGVPILAHLIVIIIGSLILLILMKIIEVIVKKSVLDKSSKKK